MDLLDLKTNLILKTKFDALSSVPGTVATSPVVLR